MKKLIFFILVGLLLTCCGRTSTSIKEYYKVVDFSLGDDIKADVTTIRSSYTGRIQVYNMTLVDPYGDTIQEKFATADDHSIRFLPGDSIFIWYGTWRLKR